MPWWKRTNILEVSELFWFLWSTVWHALVNFVAIVQLISCHGSYCLLPLLWGQPAKLPGQPDTTVIHKTTVCCCKTIHVPTYCLPVIYTYHCHWFFLKDINFANSSLVYSLISIRENYDFDMFATIWHEIVRWFLMISQDLLWFAQHDH